jgi:hypothetical protein
MLGTVELSGLRLRASKGEGFDAVVVLRLLNEIARLDAEAQQATKDLQAQVRASDALRRVNAVQLAALAHVKTSLNLIEVLL